MSQPVERSTPLLTDAAGLFASNYNKQTFLFPHGLSGHPLFELASLVELSKRMPESWENYWSNGKVAVDNRWDVGVDGRSSLPDTIANIAVNNSIVILKHTEQDPVYGPVLQDFLARLVRYSGESMRNDVVIGEALILLSSPNRITPYHLDGETNFLVQVSGDKTFYVFPHEDRTLVTHDELERYFVDDHSSAIYRKERQKDAVAHDLRAGYGVHVPSTAPHWVQNKDNVSVAISFNFELKSVQRKTKIYRLNSKLRRFGINPAPPGSSPWKDRLKIGIARNVSALRSFTKPEPVDRPFDTWTPPAV